MTTDAHPNPVALTLLYRDEWLAAFAKPSGLLVHRSEIDRHETRFALQLARDYLGQHVHAVHRLDRGTSGVLLFALDPDTARRLSAAFEQQAVHKRYWAVVRGHPPLSGCIDHPLKRLRDPYALRSGGDEEVSQPARTGFRRLGVATLPVQVDRYPSSRYAWLEISPETGRRHQIRRHLKHIAHPIIGDATYGKGAHNRLFQARFGAARLLLHCRSLELAHPHGGAALRLFAPLDVAFAAVLTGLGWSVDQPALSLTMPSTLSATLSSTSPST